MAFISGFKGLKEWMYFLLYKLYIIVNLKNKTLVWIAEIQYQIGQEIFNFCQQIQIGPRAQPVRIESSNKGKK